MDSEPIRAALAIAISVLSGCSMAVALVQLAEWFSDWRWPRGVHTDETIEARNPNQ